METCSVKFFSIVSVGFCGGEPCRQTQRMSCIEKCSEDFPHSWFIVLVEASKMIAYPFVWKPWPHLLPAWFVLCPEEVHIQRLQSVSPPWPSKVKQWHFLQQDLQLNCNSWLCKSDSWWQGLALLWQHHFVHVDWDVRDVPDNVSTIA